MAQLVFRAGKRRLTLAINLQEVRIMPRGGARPGAGRPLKEGEVRKMRGLRATDEEWNLIQRFEKILKYGDKDKAKQFVEVNSQDNAR